MGNDRRAAYGEGKWLDWFYFSRQQTVECIFDLQGIVKDHTQRMPPPRSQSTDTVA